MNTEDTPTTPGLRPVIIRRAFDRNFDDLVFDLPVRPTTFVGVRKSDKLWAERFENALLIGVCVLACLWTAAFMAVLNSL